MASPLHTAQSPQNDGSPSWLARIIAAIIYDIQYIWSFFSTSYTGSFTDANGNVIEITDGGVVASVNPDLQFTVDETFVAFRMTTTVAPLTIEWGDGTQETFAGGAAVAYSHTYADAGTYVVRINATDITIFDYSDNDFPSPNSLKSVDIIPPTLVEMGLYGNAMLTYINMAQFTACELFTLVGSPLLLNATVVVPPANFVIAMLDCFGIVDYDTTGYTQCTGFEFLNNSLVDTLDIAQLTSCSNLNISGQTALQAATITDGSVFGIINMSGCTSLTTLILPTLPSITSFNANGCTKLKVITVGNISTINTFRCGQGTRLSTSNINTILTTIDAYGTNNGTIDISGQNPPRVPTGAGATAKANLIGRGWTITTD